MATEKKTDVGGVSAILGATTEARNAVGVAVSAALAGSSLTNVFARPSAVRSAPEVIESIHSQALAVREAAHQLTNRIEQFEACLASLEGRVDTTHFGVHPDSGPQNKLELAIRLHRKEKAWVLSWGSPIPRRNPFAEQLMDWLPLKEAPLKIKIAAIKIFPNFLETIEKTQIQLVEQIEKATAAFDAFAQTLPATGKERA